MTFCPEDNFNIRKQFDENRLKELCKNEVPENEVQLLSNGRLTCLICTHRPVFDTINVLFIHRKGKKHSAEYDLYQRRIKEIEFKKLNLKSATNLKKISELKYNGPIKNGHKFQRKKRLEMFYKHPIEDAVNVNNKLPIKKLDSDIKKGLNKKKHINKSIKSLSKGTYSSSKSKQENNSNISSDVELIMSGWIKDSNGIWCKDPDAEFDSDEEDTHS